MCVSYIEEIYGLPEPDVEKNRDLILQEYVIRLLDLTDTIDELRAGYGSKDNVQ